MRSSKSKNPLMVIGVTILLVVAATRADPKLHPYTPTAETSNEVQYDYRYAVDNPKSGVVNDHWEQRYGEYVKGAYSVLEPDGKVRTVDYEVDGPKGFHAVIRTAYPGNSLLSYIQLQKSLKQHRNPPVNVLTNQKIETASSEFNNQRSAKLRQDLPVNFHSISPNYYLSLVPGQRTNYRSNRNRTNNGAFIAASPDTEVPDQNSSFNNNHHHHHHHHHHSALGPAQVPDSAPRRISGITPPSQDMLPPPVGPSVYSQFTEAIPITGASSTDFTRTHFNGG